MPVQLGPNLYKGLMHFLNRTAIAILATKLRENGTANGSEIG
jgi:hypothetical protein